MAQARPHTRTLPEQLRKRLTIKDALLRAVDLAGVSAAAGDDVWPAVRHLASHGIEAPEAWARLRPQALYGHPHLGNWAAGGVTQPALILRARTLLSAEGEGAAALDCFFLDANGGLVARNGRLRLGIGERAAAWLANAGDAPWRALIAQTTEAALAALAAGFPGAIFCALTLATMGQLPLPANVTAVALAFDARTSAASADAVVDEWRRRGIAAAIWRGGAA